MKFSKSDNLIYFFVFLLIYSCNNEFDVPLSHKTDKVIKTKSAGDNKYDVLGCGYDITGQYMDQLSTRGPILDIKKLDKDLLVDSGYINKFEVFQEAGENALFFSQYMSNRIGVNIDLKETEKSTMTATLKRAFSVSNQFNANFSYAYANYLYIKKRYDILPADISVLKNYLHPTFQNALAVSTPERLVTNYGTHVLLSIYLGGKFEAYLQSEVQTHNSGKRSSVSAGLGNILKGIFNLNIGYEYNDSLSLFNSKKSVYYTTVGGKLITGSLSPENSWKNIDLSEWESSVQEGIPHFIGGPNDQPTKFMIPIYELCSDPAKKEAIKSYIKHYIATKSTNLGGATTGASGIIEISGLGNSNQGAGSAIYDIDKNGIPDLVLMGIDNPKGENQFWYRILYDINKYGQYARITDNYKVPGVGHDNNDGGIAITDLNGNGKPDMILMCADKPTKGGAKFWYKIAYDLDINGKPDSYSGIKTVTEMGGVYHGSDIAIADFNKNGIPDMLLCAYDAPKGENQFRYKILYDLDQNGDPRTNNGPVFTIKGCGNEGAGSGVAVGDIDKNGELDIVFMALDAPNNGADLFRYKIFSNVWENGNAPSYNLSNTYQLNISPGNTSAGAAVSLYDLNNDGYLDIVLTAIEDKPGSISNTWKYIVGDRLGISGPPSQWY